MEGLIMEKVKCGAIKSFVKANQSLFEDVASKYKNAKDSDDVQYSMLNYSKILNEMAEYIEGYIDYKEKGNKNFSGKVLQTTEFFYSNMFEDKKKYRRIVSLDDMRETAAEFLKDSKNLQTVMENASKYDDSDAELRQLINLTDNQYRKLSKVYKDDMRIYMWLSTSKSPIYRRPISADLRTDFKDKTTPVIHVAGYGGEL